VRLWECVDTTRIRVGRRERKGGMLGFVERRDVDGSFEIWWICISISIR